MEIDPIKRGIRMITEDCTQCPYERLLSYPVCYCLFGVVDYSTRCPFDYDLEKAKKEYDLNRDCIEYHYNVIKGFIQE